MATAVPCVLCGGSLRSLLNARTNVTSPFARACEHCDMVCTRKNCGQCQRVSRSNKGI